MLLLTLGGSMTAQNKKVVAQTGEKVTLSPVLTTTERDALATPYIGFLIFNTTTNCHEFYNGLNGWYNYCWGGYTKGNDASTGGTAVVSGYNCSGAAAGTMTAGVAVTGVTQTITATVTTAGTYNITAAANGVIFAGTGTFAGTGAQNIVLTATGAPVLDGVYNFIMSTTPGCGFNRTIGSNISATSNGTAVITALDCAANSAGTMTAGTAVSGVTQSITATVATAGTYSISTTANGVTFAGAGTFAGTGAQTVVLTATGTPTAVGSNAYVLNTTPNCNFIRNTVSAISATSNGTAVVSAYDCSGAAAGTMEEGTAVSGVTQTITATVTTPGTYSISITANGVTFAGTGTFAATGAQPVVLTATGTPTAPGSNSFVLNTTPNCGFNRTTNPMVGTITGAAGKIWMDRNLGASQVATSSTDYLAYGSLYQWGRGSDGHQLINWTSASAGTPVNGTTGTLSSTDTPGNSLFIISNSGNYDWRNPQNNTLWQGKDGINNPCPSGYRLPTDAEFNSEVTTAGITNSATAYAKLKLVVAGYRYYGNGTLVSTGTNGYYWTSTVSGTPAYNRYFNSSGTDSYVNNRANGFSVRCLKD